MSSLTNYGIFDLTQANYIQRVDYDSNSNAIYIGWARAGALDSDSFWRIVRNTYDGQNRFIASAFPEGSPSFNYTWDNRASLAYK